MFCSILDTHAYIQPYLDVLILVNFFQDISY